MKISKKRTAWSLGLALAITAALLSGCGTTSLLDRKIDYKSAGKLPPLEVPPDLTAPGQDERYAVPDVGSSGTATYSEYNKERSVQPQAGSESVLPAEPHVRLERAGSERWLVVNLPPDKVWPVVKDFWQGMGFILKVEDPQAGIMETDWAENRAKIPQDPIRNVLGKVLDQLYSTPERDKFRTRLERSQDGKSTEIYISHRGMYEVYDTEGKDHTVWEPRPPDPGLEAEMLSRLMVRFGVQEARAKAMLAAGTTKPRAELSKGRDGGDKLLLDDQFDRAWRRVGLALDRVGFTVEDRDRSKGIYYVRYADPEADTNRSKGFLSRLAFWRSNDSKPKPEQYRILIQGAEAGTQVDVLNKDGQPEKSPTATRILSLLYEQLK